MLSQEVAQSHPGLREACARELGVWTANVARVLAAAKRRHRPRSKADPEAMAWFLNSLWQGSMLVAKACQSPAVIRRNLALARVMMDLHFGPAPSRGSAPPRRQPARARVRSSHPPSSTRTKPLQP
jgi:TetR/AcrR family transcriptional repressor of nem operon